MRAILAAVIALSVLTGVAASASAYDPSGAPWSTGQGR
jgi:TolA-binding protein